MVVPGSRVRRTNSSYLAVAVLGLAVVAAARAETISLKFDGGTFVVPVVINDQITLDFTLDSGAADVSIPQDVFSTLVRTGTIQESDYLGTQTYVLADGSTTRSHRFRIRSLRLGSLELRNVAASVAPPAGSLLLGQSFLGRLGAWAIDNRRHVLLINELGAVQSEPTITQTGRGDASTDDWYQCMKRNGWRDDAHRQCSEAGGSVEQPVSRSTPAPATDAWYECMKQHQWRDDANELCSKVSQ